MLTIEEIRGFIDHARAEVQLQGDAQEQHLLEHVWRFLGPVRPATTSELIEELEQAITHAQAAADVSALHTLQRIAGFFMRPADLVRDRETLQRFRILAAHAANTAEQIEQARENDE